MSDVQEENWEMMKSEFVGKDEDKYRKAFDYGWVCAADEAISYLYGLGHFGLAKMVFDYLYENWFDEEEVDE